MQTKCLSIALLRLMNEHNLRVYKKVRFRVGLRSASAYHALFLTFYFSVRGKRYTALIVGRLARCDPYILFYLEALFFLQLCSIPQKVVNS